MIIQIIVLLCHIIVEYLILIKKFSSLLKVFKGLYYDNYIYIYVILENRNQ